MSDRFHIAVPYEECQSRPEDTASVIESMSFWINGVLTLALVVLGVSGNAIMMASLRCNTKRWLPLYYYFMTFAIWNTTLLLATLVFYCLSALHPADVRYYENPIYAYLNIIGYPFANSGMTASVWLVLSLTVERCLVVSRPLERFVSQTKLRAKAVTIAISILAPLYSLPLFFELRVLAVEDELGQANLTNSTPPQTLYDVAKTGLRDNTAYKILYRIVCNLVFLSLGPFVIVIVLSARIVCVIRKRVEQGDRCPPPWSTDSPRPQAETENLNHNTYDSITDRHRAGVNRPLSKTVSRGRCHSRMTCEHNQRTHVTLTVLALKYVICHTLPTLLNILEIIVEPKSLRDMGLGLLVDLSDLMVVADSALNAFVYFSWRRNIQLRGLSFRSRNKAAQRQLLQKVAMCNDENRRVTLL